MCKGLATLPASCLKSARDIKHKISFLLQKTQNPPAEERETHQKKEKKEETAEERAPTAEDVEKWAESLSHLVNSEVGRRVFASFLRSEFSEENVAFWVACEDYKQAPPPQLRRRAQQIFQQYVEVDAPQQVNLDAATREETRRRLAAARPSCFTQAQRKVFILMEKDSYRRFLNSRLMQEVRHGRREDATTSTTSTSTITTTSISTSIEEKQRRKCECDEKWRPLAGGA